MKTLLYLTLSVCGMVATLPAGATSMPLPSDATAVYESRRPKSCFTATDDEEISRCISTLMSTDAGTGFMHESFHKDNPDDYTRAWFAWQNSLFGELILKLVNEGKTDLLNRITNTR